MTVKELINELKTQPLDANVVVVTDWENCDENGHLPTAIITGTTTQIYYDDQFECTEETEVLMLC